MSDRPPSDGSTASREADAEPLRGVRAGAPLLTVDEAAKLLSTTPIALRARCRRHACRVGRETIARLGAGVVAFKFGASWRLRIDLP